MSEIIRKGVVVKKEPGYLYYVDRDGNVCKKKKSDMKHKKYKQRKVYENINLTIPKVLVNALISNKPKSVRKMGQGGMIHFPMSFIGKRVYVVLIPERELETEELNVI